MLKQKLSQENMRNLTKFQQKLQRITTIEHKMYDRIIKNQHHTMKVLQQAKQQKVKCLKQRPDNIKAQTFQQIIKHPANDTNESSSGRGLWMYLANFIGQRHDLSQVQRRMLQRQQIRQNIQRVKQQQRLRQQQRVKKQKQQRQYEQRIKSGKGFDAIGDNKNSKNRKSRNKKVPFNLQRQLHRRQVQENRKRLQKMDEYKRKTYHEKNF